MLFSKFMLNIELQIFKRPRKSLSAYSFSKSNYNLIYDYLIAFTLRNFTLYIPQLHLTYRKILITSLAFGTYFAGRFLRMPFSGDF